MAPHRHTFRACRRQWCKGLRVEGLRLMALYTLAAFLAVFIVSGPHLVHHFTELYPPAAYHTDDEHHEHDAPAPPLPDCQLLFLVQHTPVSEGGEARLPMPLLALESIGSLPLLWGSAAVRYVFQARAPPFRLL
jgi:hypothetical protein